MMMKINPMETAPFEHEDFDEAPSNIFVHKGAWATIIGTNDKLAGWVDTHELFADNIYRDQILTKQYTNTREPGEFGDGVTVEKMTDEELIAALRDAADWHAGRHVAHLTTQAADRLSALSPRVKASDILSQVALWSDDEGLDLSMGQGEDLVRRIMSAIEVSASPRVVTDEEVERAAAQLMQYGLNAPESTIYAAAKAALTAALSSAGDKEGPEVVAFLVDCPAQPTLEFANVHVPDSAEPLVRQSTLTACQQEVERYKEMYVTKSNEKVAEFRRAEAAEADRDRMKEALTGLLDHIDQNTCVHESVSRGGSIWTICDDCGKKWADDRGGFVPYSDPEPVSRARAALNGEPQK